MATEPGQGPAVPGTHGGATPVSTHRDTTSGYGGPTRHADETKPAYKTTEFIAYAALLAGVLIAGLVVSGGDDSIDRLTSPIVWLYAVILTVGYMLSRGLSKAGSRHRYDDDRH